MLEHVTKVLAWIIGAIVLYIVAWYAYTAWRARLPSDMPANSIWIEAPALPFSYKNGWWFGCWIDRDGKSNRCRLLIAGADGPPVYEGIYVSCDTKSPVPANELQVIPPKDSFYMWVGNGHGVNAPAALLANGKVLTPIEVPQGCEQYQKEMHQ